MLNVWDLNQSEASAVFGVSRQAINKWFTQGVPSERVEALADIAAATDILIHYLKRERIPAVVRRKAQALSDRSLLDILVAGDTRRVLHACRHMFDFADAHV